MVIKVEELHRVHREIRAAQRELIPLTVGKVADIKLKRWKGFRAAVRLKHTSITKIQALWRGVRIRIAVADPLKAYWIECFDEEQGEHPFYYNTWTHETSWTVPLAYRYFADPKIGVLPEKPEASDWSAY